MLIILIQTMLLFLFILGFVFFFFFWLCRRVCGILVPQSGESTPLAGKTQSPNHWTAKEVPKQCYNIYTEQCFVLEETFRIKDFDSICTCKRVY